MEDRPWYIHQMYNDIIMICYTLPALYYLAKGRPFIGSFLVTMALGVKVGVMLILPALLGSIMYNHGLRALIGSVAIIISV